MGHIRDQHRKGDYLGRVLQGVWDCHRMGAERDGGGQEGGDEVQEGGEQDPTSGDNVTRRILHSTNATSRTTKGVTGTSNQSRSIHTG